MKRILAASNASVLAQYAWSNVLVAFDYDGTLAPIVVDRDGAELRPRTRALLVEVARRYPTAILSGRAHDDVETRLDGIPIAHIVGNHGMEPGVDMARHAEIVARFAHELAASLEPIRGVEIENKRYSLAIHYRKSREKRVARRAIAEATEALVDAHRVVLGKQVVNVLPDGAPHKGTALLALRDRIAADTAIFVGDDVTDEDVFALDQPGRLLSIRVGEKRSSAAPYCLERQSEIDAFLRRLVDLRPEVVDARIRA